MFRAMPKLIFLFLAVISFVLPTTVLAMTGDGAGAHRPASLIYGVVKDHSGAVVAGATIALHAANGAEPWQGMTDSLGQYRLGALPAGRYRLVVRHKGFSPSAQWVDLRAGERRELLTTLEVATLVQKVRVRASLASTALAVKGLSSVELSAATLHEDSGRDLGGALAGLAGVEVVRKAGIANDIAIRGMLGNNLAMVIDGTRLFGAGTSQMDPAAYHVDLAEVDHVEVVRGPFDVTTSGAFGGYVRVRTRSPEAQGLALHADVDTGSYGYYSPSVVAQAGRDNLHFLAGYAYRTSEFYRDGRGERVSDLGAYRNGAENLQAFRTQSGWTKLVWNLTRRQHAELGYTRQQGGEVLYPYLSMDGVYDVTDRALASYHYQSASRWLRTLGGEIYLNKVNHLMDNRLRQSAALLPYTMSTHAVALTDGARIDASFGSGLSAGYAFYRRAWDSRGSMLMSAMRMPESVSELKPELKTGAGMAMGNSPLPGKWMATHPMPDTVEDLNGAYLTYRHGFGSRLLLTSGARFGHATTRARQAVPALYEAYHRTGKDQATDSGFSGNGKLAWQASPFLTVFAGVGSVIRFPDAEELFYASDHGMGLSATASGMPDSGKMTSSMPTTMVGWVGNPTLRSPRDTEYDYGLTLRGARYHLSPLFYFSDLRNSITLYSASRLAPAMGVSSMTAQSYANVHAHQWGQQLTGSAVLGQGLTLLGSFTIDRGTKQPKPVLGIDSPNLFQVPPPTSHLRLRYQHGPLYGEFGGTVTGRQDHVDTDVHEQTTAGYSVFDLKTGYTYAHFHCEAGLDNLFARQYTQFLSYARNPYSSGLRLPSPGRSFFVHLSYDFARPKF